MKASKPLTPCVGCGAALGAAHAPECPIRSFIEEANKVLGEYWILNEAREPVPVDFVSFFRWKTHHPDAERVGYEQITPTVFVSTLFMGRNLDVRRGVFPDLNLPPQLFETCAFDGDEIIDMGRAYTWEESAEQHETVVTRMRAREAAKQRAARN